MNIVPVRNFSFCKNTNSCNTKSAIQQAKAIIEKENGIDLFLDTFIEAKNKIEKTEEEIAQLKKNASNAATQMQRNILLNKIEAAEKILKRLQNNKLQMENIIFVIDSFAKSNEPIEIEYIDRSNEEG